MFNAISFKIRTGAFFLALSFIILNPSPACFAGPNWLIRINIPEFRLELYDGGALFRAYPVAVGKPATPSPVGNFVITAKIPNPTWYPPDRKQPPVPPGPNNPLGKYWLGLSLKGYGIHGNSAPWSIGSSISLGCFRMHNPDIEELYRLVPTQTPVEIIYQTVRATTDEHNQAWLEVFPDIYNRVNQPEAISRALSEMNWGYEPHLPALAEMLAGKKPLKIMVPRRIRIVENSGNIDGFFWNQEIYLSNNILNYLPASQKATGINSFGKYLELKGLSALEHPLDYLWDETLNILYLTSLTSLAQTPP
ncbi:MAG: L,D-transpeptidase [Firmicutes bacterium]|nr:L,D-transpeptidase [Bacillota bacterium]